MRTIAAIARTLFPAEPPLKTQPRPGGRPSALSHVVAVSFALLPLAAMMHALALTS